MQIKLILLTFYSFKKKKRNHNLSDENICPCMGLTMKVTFLMWDNLINRNILNIVVIYMVNKNCPYLFCLGILWPYRMGHTNNSLCKVVHMILLGILPCSFLRKSQEGMLVMKYDYKLYIMKSILTTNYTI